MRPARRLAWLLVFALAMGWLEGTVVVYLRELYYPGGFTFPLVPMPERMALLEIAREAATIIMLMAVAALGAASRWGAFLNFAFAFGVWDLAYYAVLWVVLGWPPSLFTADILFLIPVPWVGPVLAPVVISTLLIGASVALTFMDSDGRGPRFRAPEWAAAAAGGLLVLLSFTLDTREVLAG